jgi:hypothetical protein
MGEAMVGAADNGACDGATGACDPPTFAVGLPCEFVAAVSKRTGLLAQSKKGPSEYIKPILNSSLVSSTLAKILIQHTYHSDSAYCPWRYYCWMNQTLPGVG